MIISNNYLAEFKKFLSSTLNYQSGLIWNGTIERNKIVIIETEEVVEKKGKGQLWRIEKGMLGGIEIRDNYIFALNNKIC